MRKQVLYEDTTSEMIVWFVPEREADLYQDNDEMNIFEISNKDYDNMNGEQLRKLYIDSI
jgi:hypothetical protein